MKSEFSLESITSNEVAKKRLAGFIQEAMICHRKIKSEREAIKDIRTEAKDSLNIPPKVFNKLIRLELDNNIDQEIDDLEKISLLKEMLEAVK